MVTETNLRVALTTGNLLISLTAKSLWNNTLEDQEGNVWIILK
jgi:hypothetical protein